MCCPEPSASSITPMSSRNESASIFSVGCRSMSRQTASAKTQHHADRGDDRGHHHGDVPRHPDRGEHRVEREDDVERDDLGDRGAEGGRARRPPGRAGRGTSSLSWISQVALAIRNTPPTSRIRSRPETAWPSTANSGCVRRMIQLSVSSSPMRMNIARNSPIRRALPCCSGGSLPGEDREEDDVVDPEDDLHRRQRQQRDEVLEGQQLFHQPPRSAGPPAEQRELVRDVVRDPVRVEPLRRADERAAHEHREVQVVAAGHPGLAARADRRAPRHRLALLDAEAAQVAVQREDPLAVVEDHRLAVDAEVAGERHRRRRWPPAPAPRRWRRGRGRGASGGR